MQIFFSCVILAGACTSDNNQTEGMQSDTSYLQPPEVDVIPADLRDMSSSFTVSGTLEAYRRIYIAAQKSGLIEEVSVEEGDRVRAGSVMARIDTREARAELQRAEAVFTNAERAYERIRQLYESESVARAEYESALSAYEIAESEASLWQTRVDFGTIRAPEDAYVIAKLVEQGNSVSVNERLFTIENLSDLVIRVGVSERYISSLSTDDVVSVTFDAHPGRQYEGIIRRIFPRAEVESRLFKAEISVLFEQTDPLTLRPGFLGRVTFKIGPSGPVIAVPSEAVISEDGQQYLFLLNEEELSVTKQRIQTGPERGGWVHVSEGINEGSLVVVSGFDQILAGSEVNYEIVERL